MRLCYWPVSSVRLHERGVRAAPGETAEPCTLFPFFTREGVVERVMVVRAARSEILFFDPADAKLRIPRRGPVELRTSLRVLGYEDLDRLAGLWHYDPWWVLTAPDAQYEQRSSILKQTNCVDRFLVGKYTVKSLLYSSDLRRVAWVVCSSGEGTTWKRFRAKVLPPAEAVTAESAQIDRAPAWRLAPFWQPGGLS